MEEDQLKEVEDAREGGKMEREEQIETEDLGGRLDYQKSQLQ